MAFHFRNFIPNLGLLSGSLESYGREGRFQTGDNYLQLGGLPWSGMRWTFTGGDFRVFPNLVEFPFTNVFYPELAARGFKVEASNTNRRYTFYFGGETLLEGPRVPFRIGVPQRALGASVEQKIGGRLQLGARFLRLSSGEKSIAQNPFLFPFNREFLSVNSVAVQSLYSLASRLRLYGEMSASAAERSEKPHSYAETPLSSFLGAVWESSTLLIRANYAYQGASYLPVVGYFLGDRRGPFGEVRYRPFRRLDLFGSSSRYTNNLENDPRLPTFRST
ncbi:MAG: hypothetical protein HY236_05885, partial [Acidobacteria bacterium]|nr:hypothetical protein [Acidobacteriota bacterium]